MDLVVEDAEAGKLNTLWGRRQNTFFNGASNIVQLGALSAFTEEGERECQEMIAYYMENARIIRAGLRRIGLTVFGGVSRAVFVAQDAERSVVVGLFDKLLSEAHVVGTPGSGFWSCWRRLFSLEFVWASRRCRAGSGEYSGEFEDLR